MLNYINDYKCLINNLIATAIIHSFRGIIPTAPSYTRHYTTLPPFRCAVSCSASAARFLASQALRDNEPSGFSSRLSSHEGPKAYASEPSLRKDRDSCFASAARFLASQALRDNEPSGFSSRLSSHEGPKAYASEPSLRKDRDSCFASAARFLASQALRDNEPSGFSSRLSSHEGPKACASGPSLRKDRDSNPGCPQGHNGFRDRPDRPLRHLSVFYTRSYVSFCGCKGTKCF